MCIATGLGYSVVTVAYLQEAMLFDPENYSMSSEQTTNVFKKLELIDFFVAFAWSAECSVKMSLLFFFRALVDRLQRLTLYVHVVMGITAVVWVLLVCTPFALCPHFDLSESSELPDRLKIAIPLIVGVL